MHKASGNKFYVVVVIKLHLVSIYCWYLLKILVSFSYILLCYGICIKLEQMS